MRRVFRSFEEGVCTFVFFLNKTQEIFMMIEGVFGVNRDFVCIQRDFVCVQRDFVCFGMA